MKTPILLVITLLLTAAFAQQFPTEIEINAILRGCGGGADSEIESTFNESVQIWKGESKSAGQAKARSIIAILESIENDTDKLEAYKTYAECFQASIERYVSSSNEFLGLSGAEAKQFEAQLLAEVAKNLGILDSKLWLMEQLVAYDGDVHTKPGVTKAFGSAVKIPFSTDRYEILEKHLDKLPNGYEIKRFYRWLHEAKTLHQTILNRFESMESVARRVPERIILAGVFMAQQQGLYLYVYGCKLVGDRTDCEERLSRIQVEFRGLEKLDKSIMDIELDTLEMHLEEASGEINDTRIRKPQ